MLGCLLPLLAAGQAGNPVPARIITRYALTVTQDTPGHDPKSWRLFGSNDRGASWTQLDAQTNQIFSPRSQRRMFRVPNRTAFSSYRLQIDETDGSRTAGMDMSVQLAEIELLGPLTGTDKESDVQEIITSSRAHPLLGPAENAFDNDPMTRWRDYGLGTPGGCWIQCQYAYHAELAVTNVSEVQRLVHLTTDTDWMYDQGPRILSNLTSHVLQPFPQLTGYALTSANDEPKRDPQTWCLLGSDDGGATWRELDARANEIFDERFQRRVFALTNSAACAAYRLEIRSPRAPGNMTQLGEIEPIYSRKAAADAFSMVVSANSDNPPIESCEAAFDGDPKSKWLSISADRITTAQPSWIQWQYISREEGLPVIGRHPLDSLNSQLQAATFTAQTNRLTRVLSGYALTSANDFPECDPRDWRLLGSRDGATHWDLLDARQHEVFSARRQRRVFKLTNEVAYPLYRLQVDSVADPALTTSIQLAEIEPLYPAADTSTNITVFVSAQGENGARESADHAFDRMPETKWLDFADTSSNRASWIEWQYAKNVGVPVVNLDRLHASQQNRAPQRRLSLRGVVVSSDPEAHTIGFLDETGFQVFEIPETVSYARSGEQIRLQGHLRFRRGMPLILDPQFVPLGALKAVRSKQTEESLAPNQSFYLTTVEGIVNSISLGRFYSTLSLSSPDRPGEQRVRIVGAGLMPTLSLMNCRIQVRGVLQPQITPAGRRVAGVVWGAGWEAISLAASSEQDWAGWRSYALAALAQTNLPPWEVIRVRGTVLNQPRRESFLLGNGDAQMVVRCREAACWTAGSEVEAAGFLIKDGGRLALLSALVRPGDRQRLREALANDEFAQDRPAADIRDIRNRLLVQPSSSFPFRIRGVVTYVDLALGEFYLQNESDSILLLGQLNAGLSPFQHQEGECVEVEGEASEGRLYATSFVRVLGRAGMPPPVRHSWNYLMLGEDDGKWTELEGVISAVEKQRLTLTVGGENIVAWVNELDKKTHAALLGTLVRVAGVCSPVRNSRNQRVGFRLLVPSGEFIQVINAVPEDPFELPNTPIGKILQARSSEWNRPAQIIKTHGIVTYCEPSQLFVQDGADGLRVVLRTNQMVEPGDLMEVAGRVEPDGFSIKLVQAVMRKTGHTGMLRALPIDLLESDSGSQGEARDGTRVQLDAVVLAQHFDGVVQTLILQHDQTHRTFSAFIPVGADPLLVIAPGSRVRLEGVFKAIRGTVDIDQAVTAFELYVPSTREVLVLDRPSWWTTRHAIWSLGGLGAVLMASLGWAYSLRHQVRQRTHELNKEIEERQMVEQRRVVEQERTRVAQDLHDELGAGLTEMGLLGDLVKNPAVPPSEKQRYLGQLTDTARSLVASLDEIVWAVNPHYDSVASLASYCTLFAQRFLDLAHVACRPQIPPSFPEYPLDSKKRHSLFLAFREALNNVVCHSGASEVRLTINIIGDDLVIAVSDNGCGFESVPQMPGKDGLASMQRRMSQLGGSCQIRSRPGSGTEVELRFPIQSSSHVHDQGSHR